MSGNVPGVGQGPDFDRFNPYISPRLSAGVEQAGGIAKGGQVIKNMAKKVATKFHRIANRIKTGEWVNNAEVCKKLTDSATTLQRNAAVLLKKERLSDSEVNKAEAFVARAIKDAQVIATLYNKLGGSEKTELQEDDVRALGEELAKLKNSIVDLHHKIKSPQPLRTFTRRSSTEFALDPAHLGQRGLDTSLSDAAAALTRSVSRLSLVRSEADTEAVAAREPRFNVDKILRTIGNAKLTGVRGVNLPQVSGKEEKLIAVDAPMARALLVNITSMAHVLTENQIDQLKTFLTDQQVKVYVHAKTTKATLTNESKEAVRKFLEDMQESTAKTEVLPGAKVRAERSSDRDEVILDTVIAETHPETHQARVAKSVWDVAENVAAKRQLEAQRRSYDQLRGEVLFEQHAIIDRPQQTLLGLETASQVLDLIAEQVPKVEKAQEPNDVKELQAQLDAILKEQREVLQTVEKELQNSYEQYDEIRNKAINLGKSIQESVVEEKFGQALELIDIMKEQDRTVGQLVQKEQGLKGKRLDKIVNGYREIANEYNSLSRSLREAVERAERKINTFSEMPVERVRGPKSQKIKEESITSEQKLARFVQAVERFEIRFESLKAKQGTRAEEGMHEIDLALKDLADQLVENGLAEITRDEENDEIVSVNDEQLSDRLIALHSNVRDYLQAVDVARHLSEADIEAADDSETDTLDTATLDTATLDDETIAKRTRQEGVRAEVVVQPGERIEVSDVGRRETKVTAKPSAKRDLGAWKKPLQQSIEERKAAEQAYERSYAAKAKKGAEVQQPVKAETDAEKTAKRERFETEQARFKEVTGREKAVKGERVETAKVQREPIPKFAKFKPAKEIEKPSNIFEVLESDIEAPDYKSIDTGYESVEVEEVPYEEPKIDLARAKNIEVRREFIGQVMDNVSNAIKQLEEDRRELGHNIGGLKIGKEFTDEINNQLRELQRLGSVEFTDAELEAPDVNNKLIALNESVKAEIELINGTVAHLASDVKEAQKSHDAFKWVREHLEDEIKRLKRESPDSRFDIGRLDLVLDDLDESHRETVERLNDSDQRLVSKLLDYRNEVKPASDHAERRAAFVPVGEDPFYQIAAQERRDARNNFPVLSEVDISALHNKILDGFNKEVQEGHDRLNRFENAAKIVSPELKGFLADKVREARQQLAEITENTIEGRPTSEELADLSDRLNARVEEIVNEVEGFADILVDYRNIEKMKKELRENLENANPEYLEVHPEYESAIHATEAIIKQADEALASNGDIDAYRREIAKAHKMIIRRLDSWDEISLAVKMFKPDLTAKESGKAKLKDYIRIQENKVTHALSDLKEEISRIEEAIEGSAVLGSEVREDLDQVIGEQKAKLKKLRDEFSHGFLLALVTGQTTKPIKVEDLTPEQTRHYRKEVEKACKQAEAAIDNLAPFSDLAEAAQERQKALQKLDKAIEEYRKNGYRHLAADLVVLREDVQGAFKVKGVTTGEAVREGIQNLKAETASIEKAIDDAYDTSVHQLLIDSLRVSLPEGKLRVLEMIEDKYGKDAEKMEDYRHVREEILSDIRGRLGFVVTEGEKIIGSELKLLEELAGTQPVDFTAVKSDLEKRKEAISKLREQAVKSGLFGETATPLERLDSKGLRRVLNDAMHEVKVQQSILSEDPFFLREALQNRKDGAAIRKQIRSAIEELRSPADGRPAQIRLAAEVEADLNKILGRTVQVSKGFHGPSDFAGELGRTNEEMKQLLSDIPRRRQDSNVIDQMKKVKVDSDAAQRIRKEVVRNINDDVKSMDGEIDGLLEELNTPSIKKLISKELKDAIEQGCERAMGLLDKYRRLTPAQIAGFDHKQLVELRKQADEARAAVREFLGPHLFAFKKALDADKEMKLATPAADEAAKFLAQHPDQVFSEAVFNSGRHALKVKEEKLLSKKPESLEELNVLSSSLSQTAGHLIDLSKAAKEDVSMTLFEQLDETQRSAAKLREGARNAVHDRIAVRKAEKAEKQAQLENELSDLRGKLVNYYKEANKSNEVTSQLGPWQGIASEDNKRLEKLFKEISKHGHAQQLRDAKEIVALIEKALAGTGKYRVTEDGKLDIHLGSLKASSSLASKGIKKVSDLLDEISQLDRILGEEVQTEKKKK